jgi:hypothetical protein
VENTKEQIKKRLEPLFTCLRDHGPKTIAGVKDGWDNFEVLNAEGISLKLKTFCDQISDPEYNCDYMECESVCSGIIDFLRRDLLDQINNYIQNKEGAKSEYIFLELFSQ